ncbi:MAG: hypothetical protein IGQ88_12305 [Gloeomargaritaceae cyanobacterium C42_A2020_066]|nr:hypothetical protein [Gloeomargaritaceae cyanobacterium C42_A2020_066]
MSRRNGHAPQPTIAPDTHVHRPTPPAGRAIHPRHRQEWLDSGVSPDIIERNVRSTNDPREVDELLNRNTDRRWRHSDNLVPAWVVDGLDPSSGERWGLGV